LSCETFIDNLSLPPVLDDGFLPPSDFDDCDESEQKESEKSLPLPAFDSNTVNSNSQKEKDPSHSNMLDTIVGNLIKLTTNNDEDNNFESDYDSDDSDGSPPPLPSSPPPESDIDSDEMLPPLYNGDETDRNSWIDVQPNLLKANELFFNKKQLETSNNLPSGRPLPAKSQLPPSDKPQVLLQNKPELSAASGDSEASQLEEQMLLPAPADELILPSTEMYDFELPPPPLNEDLPPPITDDDDDDTKEEESISPDLLPPPLFPEEDDYDEDKDKENEAIDESIPINQWSVDQVCKWLVEIGLGIYCQTFQENEIIGEHLLDLSRDDLKDLGINKVGHLKTLQQKLEQERNK
jgi:hypothetical protein